MMPVDLDKRSMSSSLWQDGWYRFASRCESPNFGSRPAQQIVDLVVLHAISLPPGCYDGDHVQQFFTNQLDCQAHPYFKCIEGLQVSAHFFIRRNGELWQFVSCDDRAWHAGVSSYKGRENCNDNSVGIELEGLNGDTFNAAQYETLSLLCAAIMQHYAITAIVGHEHIAPGRKNDPGPGFDWQLLKAYLALDDRSLPIEVNNSEPV